MKKLTVLALTLMSQQAMAGIEAVELKTGWPEAIKCVDNNDGREWIFRMTAPKTSGGLVNYSAFYSNTGRASMSYNANGSYHSIQNASGSWDCATNSWSISDLNTQKRAFYSFYYQP